MLIHVEIYLIHVYFLSVISPMPQLQTQ